MDTIKNFEEWRTEEITKVFLLKSGLDIIISKYPTPLFDLFIQLKKNTKIKFAIEVKTKSRFQSKINNQIEVLKRYRDSNVIDLPVLLFKIDEKTESGEMDFLVLPSFKENKLLVKYIFEFEPLTAQNFRNKVDTITEWFNR